VTAGGAGAAPGVAAGGAAPAMPAVVEDAASTVRVQTRSLDALLRTAGTLMALSRRPAAAIPAVARTREELGRLQRDWERVRLAHGRALRGLAEATGNGALARFLDTLDGRLRDLERDDGAWQRGHRRGTDDLLQLAEQLQDEVRAARL